MGQMIAEAETLRSSQQYRTLFMAPTDLQKMRPRPKPNLLGQITDLDPDFSFSSSIIPV